MEGQDRSDDGGLVEGRRNMGPSREERALRREEVRGIRQTPMAENWAEMLADFCKDRDETDPEGVGECSRPEVG